MVGREVCRHPLIKVPISYEQTVLYFVALSNANKESDARRA
jgi:hypothetical protein